MTLSDVVVEPVRVRVNTSGLGPSSDPVASGVAALTVVLGGAASRIVTTAALSPNTTPTGFDSSTVNVSVGSGTPSLTSGIVIVAVWLPTVNVTVPATAV